MKEDADITLQDVEVSDALAELLAKHSLPDGVPDADLNKDELARVFDTTQPTLTRWMQKQGFPIVQEGGQGRQYIFRLSHVYAWHADQRTAETTRAEQAAKSIQLMQANFLGMAETDPDAGLTAKQRRELADADFAHSRAAQARRQLVRLEDMEVLIDDLMKTFRDGAEGLTDRLERELSLTPSQLSVVQAAAGDILETLIERIDREQLQESSTDYVAPQGQLLI